MKVEIKLPKAKCQYCGKPYKKNHGNQKYCSYNCKHNAKKEQVARARMKHYHNNKQLGGDKVWGLGTSGLGQHRQEDHNIEYQKIQNEKKRLHLKF